ncbi:MAG TPA: type IV pilus secretin PilQ [Vicinamibacterales bacterium]|nr:type IV pilus secretin PilQ [Vicinamibacterales bacterium]
MALSLAVMLATAASVVSRASGTTATIAGAKLTTITSRADARTATLVIEATEPVPYVATRPDPLTIMIDFRNVEAGAVAASAAAQARGPIASVAVEAAESLGAPVSRVRIALAQPVAHHVRADRNRILIDFDRAKEVKPEGAAAANAVARSIVQTGVDPLAALGLTGASRPVTLPTTMLLANAAQAPAQPPVATPLRDQRGPRTYSGNPVSLDFQQADLRAVLRVFAEISGLNIVIDPAVKGTVDVALRDVPWDQALDIILRANKLGYIVDGTVVRIAPLATLADEENQRRKLADEQALAGDLKVLTRVLSYARAEDLQQLLTRSVLSKRGTVQVDPRTNTLIISDLPESLEQATSLLATLDVAQPQVEIEARIVKTEKQYARALGVQWGVTGRVDPALGNTTNMAFPNNGSITGGGSGTKLIPPAGTVVNLPVEGAPSAIGLAMGAINGAFNLDVALSALEKKGNARLLSTPRVTTQNNIEAEIAQGVQIPYQTVANNTTTTQFKDAALTLKVMPQITAVGTVIMKISVDNGSRGPDAGSPPQPSINTQRASTTVLVNDGQTTVLGGIYASEENSTTDSTPGLGRIPFLKWLFRRDAVNDNNSELLIFITPRIIKG